MGIDNVRIEERLCSGTSGTSVSIAGKVLLPDRWQLRPSFFNYLVYGSADPFFQDLKNSKKNSTKFYIFFFYKFSFACPKPGARIKKEDLRLRPALNPLANKVQHCLLHPMKAVPWIRNRKSLTWSNAVRVVIQRKIP